MVYFGYIVFRNDLNLIQKADMQIINSIYNIYVIIFELYNKVYV